MAPSWSQWIVFLSLQNEGDPMCREIVENVLSEMKAGFKASLNFEHAIERKKMENLNSKSTFCVILLTLTLMVAALGVSSAVGAEKKMVKDPTTGEMVSAPEYGGSLTFAKRRITPAPDMYHGHALSVGSVVIEKLAVVDWAIDRNKYPMVGGYQAPVFALRGALAESWEQPDPTTYVFHIRQGVHWHDKPPMSGRELTAKDIEYNYHRHLGLGSGFTEPSPCCAQLLGELPWESIEATDEWTVVMKLKEPRLDALGTILDGYYAIQAPEVIEASRTDEVPEGKISDWRDMVGTGPYMLTDWVQGSSFTYTKNPNYWSDDEKYPGNRLPYIDELRGLVMPELATLLSALRTAKVEYLGWQGATQLSAVDQAESLRRTNPELVIHTWSERSNNMAWLNSGKPPFNDIRVRRAAQMALDVETMSDTLYKGFGDPKPRGRVGLEFKGYYVPFEEWPEEIKGYYTYDVERARELLDEAGYPRGADGIRFKTNLVWLDRGDFDLNWAELAASYWREIGIRVDIEHVGGAEFGTRAKDGDTGAFSWASGVRAFPPRQMEAFWSGFSWNIGVRDAQYDAWYEAMLAATTVEEQRSAIQKMDMYSIEQHWMIWGALGPAYNVHWPWVIGYNGEGGFGRSRNHDVFARLWIDSELKEEMGH